MRAAIVDVPLIGTSRVVDLDAAERLVGSGAADAVGMTRALIADPELRGQGGGRPRRRGASPCIGCNQGCIGHYHAGVPIGCIVNPRTGRERTLPRAPAPARRRRVLVVGGGPAGVAAALEAARARRRASMLARAPAQLGGQLRARGPRARATASCGERCERWTPDRLLARRRRGPARHRGDGGGRGGRRRRRRSRPGRGPTPAAARRPAPFARPRRAATRSPTRRPSPARCSSPTGAAAGTASTRPRCWPSTGSTSRYACAARVPRRGRSTSTSATSTSAASTSAASPSSTTPRSRPAARSCATCSPAGLPAPRGVGTLVLAQGRVPDDALWAELEAGGRAACAPATCSVRAAPRRRCSRDARRARGRRGGAGRRLTRRRARGLALGSLAAPLGDDEVAAGGSAPPTARRRRSRRPPRR